MVWAVRLGAVLVACALLVHAEDPDEHALHAIRARLRRERRELHGYRTGNRTEQGNWTVPDDRALAAPHLAQLYEGRPENAVYYQNTSGFVHGNLSGAVWEPKGSQRDPVKERGDVDWLGRPTRLELHVVQYGAANVSRVSGSMLLKMPTNASTTRAALELDLAGVSTGHGRLYMVGVPRTSPENVDMRGVLGMLPDDPSMRNDTAVLIEENLDERIGRVSMLLQEHSALPEMDTFGQTASNCSMQIYAQLLPVALDAPAMHLVEEQAAHPSGIRAPKAPPLEMELLALSPRCALRLHSNTLQGVTTAVFWAKGREYAVGMLTVLLLLLSLMVRMSERTSTPSAIATLSGTSWFLQTMYDAHIALAHVFVAISLDPPLSLLMVGVCAYPVRDCVPFGDPVCRVRIPVGRACVSSGHPHSSVCGGRRHRALGAAA